MGHLKFSEVNISIQNYLYNRGTQAYFFVSKQIYITIKGDEKNRFVIFSIILPVMYIHDIKPFK